jgi:hypothetical protein
MKALGELAVLAFGLVGIVGLLVVVAALMYSL